MNDPKELVAELKLAQARLGELILKAHRRLWPKGVNGTYRVIDYEGWARVEFDMPAVKEQKLLDKV